jgi:hypothetical protein
MLCTQTLIFNFFSISKMGFFEDFIPKSANGKLALALGVVVFVVIVLVIVKPSWFGLKSAGAPAPVPAIPLVHNQTSEQGRRLPDEKLLKVVNTSGQTNDVDIARANVNMQTIGIMNSNILMKERRRTEVTV